MFGEVSLEDALGAPFFTLGTAVSSGLATVTVFSTDLSSTAINIGTGGFSFAFLLSIIPLIAAFITSELDMGDLTSLDGKLEQQEVGAFGLGLGTVIALEISSGLQNAVASNEFLALGALGLASISYYIVAYRYGSV